LKLAELDSSVLADAEDRNVVFPKKADDRPRISDAQLALNILDRQKDFRLYPRRKCAGRCAGDITGLAKPAVRSHPASNNTFLTEESIV
jgi:hypothetical protein